MSDPASAPPIPDDPQSLRREVLSLRESVAQLTVLNEVARAVSTARSLSQVLSELVERTRAHMGAEQGVIWLLEPEAEANPLKTLVRSSQGRLDGPAHLKPSLAGYVCSYQQTLIVDDLAADPRFPGIAPHVGDIRTVLAAPLVSRDRLIGVLALFNKRAGTFTQADARLASILGTQSAQTVENAQLLEQERLREALDRDLKLAHTVQQQLLPGRAPSWPGFDVAGHNVPARDVGGDSYDFLELGGGRVGVALADVSGKGAPAALLMASLHAILDCLSRAHADPAECVARVNDTLCRYTASGQFATLFYATLDLATGRFQYCNAGHNYPLLLRADGTLESLETGGIPVGSFPGWKYLRGESEIRPGDHLLIYSDGISEAENPAGAMFGDDAVGVVFRSLAARPWARDVVREILAAVRRFAAGTPQSDDQTLVVLRALPAVEARP